MENLTFSLCKECELEFDELFVVPVVLQCGHSMCQKCVSKLFESNPLCPICKHDITGDAKSYPINYPLLQVVKLAETIRENKAQAEIAQMDSSRLETILRRNFKFLCDGFMKQIFLKTKRGENVFSFRQLKSKSKFGKISSQNNFLLCHSLHSSQADKDSYLIQFDNFKLWLKPHMLCTFLKINCPNKKEFIMLIEMMRTRKEETNTFINLCTGEQGLSYKEGYQIKSSETEQSSAEQGYISQFHVFKNSDVKSLENVNFTDYVSMQDGSVITRDSFPSYCRNIFFVKTIAEDGSFSLVRPLNGQEPPDTIGKVWDPEDACELLENEYDIKIVDCGLALRMYARGVNNDF